MDIKAKLEEIDRALPPARLVEMWRAVPERSLLRRCAKNPQFDQAVKRAFAQLGYQPFPGMSAGETYLAYMHGIAATPALANPETFGALATWTRGAFGDASALHGTSAIVRDAIAQEAHATEVDALAGGVGDKQREREEQLAKLNGREVKAPKNERDPAGAHGGLTRQTMRDLAKEARVKSGAPKRQKFIANKEALHKELLYRKSTGMGVDGLELSGEMRRDPSTVDLLKTYERDFPNPNQPADGGPEGAE